MRFRSQHGFAKIGILLCAINRTHIGGRRLGRYIVVLIGEISSQHRIACQGKVIRIVRGTIAPAGEFVAIFRLSRYLNRIAILVCIGTAHRTAARVFGIDAHRHIFRFEESRKGGISNKRYDAVFTTNIVVPTVELVAIVRHSVYRNTAAKFVPAGAFDITTRYIATHRERYIHRVFTEQSPQCSVLCEFEIMPFRGCHNIHTIVAPTNKLIAIIGLGSNVHIVKILVLTGTCYGFGHRGIRFERYRHFLLFEGGRKHCIRSQNDLTFLAAGVVVPMVELVAIVRFSLNGTCRSVVVVSGAENRTARTAVFRFQPNFELMYLEYGIQ